MRGGANERGYTDGEYFTLVLPEDTDGECSPGFWRLLPELSDFVLELDVRFVEGREGSWYVDYRLWNDHEQNTWGGYEVQTNFWGDGLIRRYVSGYQPNLAHFRYPVVDQGYGTSHLQLVSVGSKSAVRLNGDWVAFAEDPEYTERFARGALSLKTCVSPRVEPQRVHWDNVKIWESRILQHLELFWLKRYMHSTL